ncbi:signal recognition particle-docking protein FtsY [Luminiphilus sp.]|nr:signal recognition particle-docking protein FtsY [Luminiphilus sp.]MDA8985731.1 signal recognition particle-docking protein FtsY [Luminiphilus sp.]
MKLFKRRAKTESGSEPEDRDVLAGEPSPEAAAVPAAPQEESAASPSVAADHRGEALDAKPAETAEPGMFERLRTGLGRSRTQLSEGLASLVLGKKQLDPALMEALEEQLIMADMGLEATARVLELLRQRLDRKSLSATETVMSALKETLVELLIDQELPLKVEGHRPFVILVVGVNGAGKTTTIGKLAHRYQQQGRSVMLAAGDTFRAAAVEQLEAWGQRHDVPVIAQHTGADSASVLYDALQAASARGVDVLIADTAGRLQNKAHLMDELAKVVRVMRKQNPAVPHETLLVLDAGTGQNAVSQAVEFDQTIGVTGVAVTKLDGTARGGVLFAIANKLKRPIRFIGIGEQAEDLRDFSAQDFVDGLLDDQ